LVSPAAAWYLFYFFTKNLLWEQIFCEKDGPFPVFLGNMWLFEPHVSQKGYFFRPAGGEKNSLMEDRVTRVNEVRREDHATINTSINCAYPADPG
jgi:hypothetical protein